MKNRRRGLTLVELIVVSGVGSILLGLALPAIQFGKEEANRLECLDNLRRIALASHKYDDLIGELPPYMGVPTAFDNNCSTVFENALEYQLTYSLVQLLDFIGQSALVDAVDPFAFSSKPITIGNVGYSNFDPHWLQGIDKTLPGIQSIVFDIQISKYRCPSDPAAPTNQIYFGSHPTDVGCIHVYQFTANQNVYSITNYVTNAGAIGVTTHPSQSLVNAGFVGFHGPIRTRESDSVDEIPDGASNVVMFAESLGAIQPDSTTPVNRRYSMAMGGISIGRPDLYNPESQLFGTTTDALWTQFGSAHPDVVNIVRADGSAQSINRNVNPTFFGRLCGAADGLPLERGFGL